MSGKFCELGALSNLKLIGLFFKNKNSFTSLTLFKLSYLFLFKKIF